MEELHFFYKHYVKILVLLETRNVVLQKLEYIYDRTSNNKLIP